MSLDLEILSPTDRPVLLGITSADVLDYANGVLDQMGFKVHTASSHEEFLDRFARVQYEVILLEDAFCGPMEQNESLQTLQLMPMALRRHATVLLLSDTFASLDALIAFQQSVHATVNRADLDKLMLIVQQVVNDNTLFLNTYRDVQRNIAAGKK
jgi:sulfur transfer complex TusBCD TusB component (DsrH family)